MGFYDPYDDTNKVDIGSQYGTQWSLSSQKPGNGIEQLRSDDVDSLWQSDGVQPHLINIQFARRTAVTHVSIYVDFTKDDSYTPTRIAIKAGTHYHDLVEVRFREFEKPVGWKHFQLDHPQGEASECSSSSSSPSSSEGESSDSHSAEPPALRRARKAARRAARRQQRDESRHRPIWTYLLQVCILSNHLNGKDSHLRGIKVFGPPDDRCREAARRRRERLEEARMGGGDAKGKGRSSSGGKGAMPRLEDAQRGARELLKAVWGEDESGKRLEKGGLSEASGGVEVPARRTFGPGTAASARSGPARAASAPMQDDEEDDDVSRERREAMERSRWEETQRRLGYGHSVR